MNPSKPTQTSVGGIWYSQKRQGMLLMTIEIDGQKHQFVAFKNDFKKGNQPDFKVFKNRASESQPAAATPAPQAEPAPKAGVFAEDVPF